MNAITAINIKLVRKDSLNKTFKGEVKITEVGGNITTLVLSKIAIASLIAALLVKVKVQRR